MAFLFLSCLQRILSYCNLVQNCPRCFPHCCFSTAVLIQTYLLDLDVSSFLLHFPQKSRALGNQHSVSGSWDIRQQLRLQKWKSSLKVLLEAESCYGRLLLFCLLRANWKQTHYQLGIEKVFRTQGLVNLWRSFVKASSFTIWINSGKSEIIAV